MTYQYNIVKSGNSTFPICEKFYLFLKRLFYSKQSKAYIAARSFECLGYIVSADPIETHQAKIDKVENINTHNSQKNITRILGLINLY